MRVIILASVSAFAVAACSGTPATPIRDFGIVTISQVEKDLKLFRELVLPPTFQTLPQPDPNGVNRAEY